MKILDAMGQAERQAWNALSRYKFWMFGYHASRWVTLNQIAAARSPNPFVDAVSLARKKKEQRLEGYFRKGEEHGTSEARSQSN